MDTHLNVILPSTAFFSYNLSRWWTMEAFSVFFFSFIKAHRGKTYHLCVISLVISFHERLDLFEWQCFWFGKLETKPSFSTAFSVMLLCCLSCLERSNYYYSCLDWATCAYFTCQALLLCHYDYQSLFYSCDVPLEYSEENTFNHLTLYPDMYTCFK